MRTVQLILGLSLLSFVSSAALASPTAHKAAPKHKAAKVAHKAPKKSSKRASKSVGKRVKHADNGLLQPKWL